MNKKTLLCMKCGGSQLEFVAVGQLHCLNCGADLKVPSLLVYDRNWLSVIENLPGYDENDEPIGLEQFLQEQDQRRKSAQIAEFDAKLQAVYPKILWRVMLGALVIAVITILLMVWQR